jgi:phosphoribosyl 1,2-cyclic phosphodiesterase
MSDREHFYPNTEELGADEMRITALGTGRPFLRRAQANASWLIELGNGDKFIFDFGFGSQKNFTALEIPYQDITASFATHLHTDHVGDFAQIWIGSWAGGRLKPLEVYGPSGPEPKYGFRYFVEKQMESYAWDTDTRVGFLPAIGAEVNVHGFDYAKVHVVYVHGGVKITSFPAVHIYDGPVGLRLDWNGLSFVYSGDTTPSHFMIENARDVDVLSEMEREIRRNCAGELSLAADMMVWNVTQKRIRTRMAEQGAPQGVRHGRTQAAHADVGLAEGDGGVPEVTLAVRPAAYPVAPCRARARSSRWPEKGAGGSRRSCGRRSGSAASRQRPSLHRISCNQRSAPTRRRTPA